MHRLAAGALIALIAATPALGSASLQCRVEDGKIKLGVGAAFTRGLGGGLINFGAGLDVLLPGTPPDFRALHIEKSDVSQIWYYGRDVKMQLHRERPSDGPWGSVDLVIETREVKAGEGLYRGSYQLTLNFAASREDRDGKELKARGKVECSAD